MPLYSIVHAEKGAKIVPLEGQKTLGDRLLYHGLGPLLRGAFIF